MYTLAQQAAFSHTLQRFQTWIWPLHRLCKPRRNTRKKMFLFTRIIIFNYLWLRTHTAHLHGTPNVQFGLYANRLAGWTSRITRKCKCKKWCRKFQNCLTQLGLPPPPPPPPPPTWHEGFLLKLTDNIFFDARTLNNILKNSKTSKLCYFIRGRICYLVWPVQLFENVWL
jgi:hypothetical protein